MSRKTVLITGCSDGGLGAALAIAFHNTNNWRVLATSRNPKKMASLTALGIETLALDVQSDSSLKACVETVSKMAQLDMLINNAGGGYTMPVSDLSIAETKSLFDLNVFSVLSTIQAFLPLLLANPNGALLVNHTSVASVTAGPFQGPYSASKAALASFSEAMRLELAPFGIKVIDLKTARVHSNFFGNVTANDRSVTLPEGSIYNVAKDTVESLLRGEPLHTEAMDAHVWAKKVVGDLTQKNPPNVVWRGMAATLVWVGTFFPSWMMDPQVKKLMLMDEVERKILAQRKKEGK